MTPNKEMEQTNFRLVESEALVIPSVGRTTALPSAFPEWRS